MDIDKKLYRFKIIEGISLIYYGILLMVGQLAQIEEKTKFCLLFLSMVLIMISTIEGSTTYYFLRKHNKEKGDNTIENKRFKPKHVIYFLLINLMGIFNLMLFNMN